MHRDASQPSSGGGIPEPRFSHRTHPVTFKSKDFFLVRQTTSIPSEQYWSKGTFYSETICSFDLHWTQGEVSYWATWGAEVKKVPAFGTGPFVGVPDVQPQLPTGSDCCLRSHSRIWVQTKPCCQYRWDRKGCLAASGISILILPAPCLFSASLVPFRKSPAAIWFAPVISPALFCEEGGGCWFRCEILAWTVMAKRTVLPLYCDSCNWGKKNRSLIFPWIIPLRFSFISAFSRISLISQLIS